MKNLVTALALIAITAGSLVATEGASFASVRHGKRSSIQKTQGVKKARKSVRRHRKSVKKTASPGARPNAIEKAING